MLEEFSILEKKVQRLLEEYMILKEKDDHYLKLLQDKGSELDLFVEEQELLKKENEDLKKLIKDANEREDHVKAKLYSVSKILDSFDLNSLPKKDEVKKDEVKKAFPPQNNTSNAVQEEEKHIPTQTTTEQKLEITPSTEEDLIDLNNRQEDPFSLANDKDWDSSIEEEKEALPTKESTPLLTEESMPELVDEGNNDEYMLDTEDDEFHFGLENEKS